MIPRSAPRALINDVFWLKFQCRSYVARSFQHVVVPCKASGSIGLDVHRPASSSKANNVIIYLPRGNVFEGKWDANDSRSNEHNLTADSDGCTTDKRISARLSDLAAATVVQINYRLGKQHTFPTPVHDVLTGYDWITQSLIPSAKASTSGASTLRLGVCGELIGGTLATMLALSECKITSPYRISAAAISNPIVDWIFPETPPTAEDAGEEEPKAKTRRRRKQSQPPLYSWPSFSHMPPLTASTLLTVRDRLFSPLRPDKWFDPFASPILLLRTPGTDTPPRPREDKRSSAEDVEFAALRSLHFDEDGVAALEADAARVLTADLADAAVEMSGRRRKVPRRFPPSGTDPIIMPSMHVAVGSDCVLRDQVMEMVGLLRRAIVKYAAAAEGVGDKLFDDLMGAGREDWVEESDSGHMDEEQARIRLERLREIALRRIQLDLADGQALWSEAPGHPANDKYVENVGKWFADVFNES